MMENTFNAAKYVKFEQFTTVLNEMHCDATAGTALLKLWLETTYQFKALANSNHIRMKASGLKMAIVALGADEIHVQNLQLAVFPATRTTAVKVTKDVKFS